MLDEAPVSAAVIALGMVDVIRIERAELEQVMVGDEKLGGRFYRSLAETLARRLRATNGKVQKVFS